MKRGVEPPRVARRLLERALPADVRQEVLGDLEEVFRRRCATAGAGGAWLWYWGEALSFTGRFLRERLRRDEAASRPSSQIGASRAGRVAGMRPISSLDIKLGLRMLAKYPGLTSIGAIGIMVAVALAAAWFEFSQNITDPRLPFEDADRIVRIRNWDAAAAAPEPRSLHDFAIWRRELESVDELTAISPAEFRVVLDGGRSESVVGGRVTASMFRLTRVKPLLGRPLIDADEAPGALPTVVLGHDLWQRAFDGDAGMIGRTVRLGSTPTTVVGVMPEGFGFPVNQELWTAFRDDPLDHAPREGPSIIVFGRFAAGVSRTEAQAELTAVGARMATEFPTTHERLRPRVGSFGDVGEAAIVARGVNLVFLLFLFVVCVNIATLVFARTVTREGEIALRSALGASRRRIVLQLFTEALVLTSLASALGLAVAGWGLGWGMELMWEVQQSRPPFWFDARLSWWTALYVAALAVFGAAVIGVVPAMKATGRRIQAQLALVGSSSSRLKFGRASTAVIVLQVALSVAFLPLAVMAARDLIPDQRGAGELHAGALLSGRLTIEEADPVGVLSDAERSELLARTAALQEEVRRRLAAEPGIADVTYANRLPGMNHPAEWIVIERSGAAADSVAVDGVRTLAVDLDFFEAMNAPVVSGRAFQGADIGSAVDVVVVGRSFAEERLKGRNAVGQRLRYPNRRDAEGSRWYEIVGVVEDPAIVAYGAGEYVGVYRPLPAGAQAAVQLYVSAESNPEALLSRIHSVVESVDQRLAVDELQSMEEIWKPVRRSDRFFVVALVTVSAIAMTFSLAGIYALMSFTVAQRAREIAIRAALGAHPRRLIAAIFSRALAQIGIGVLVGGTLVSMTIVETRGGAKIVAGVALLMTTVGLIACAVPAWRALRIHPADVLRESN